MRAIAIVRYALVAATAALFPAVASAQIFTPTFMSPRPGSSLGVYLSDFDPGDFGIEGIYRSSYGGYDLGFRAGIVDVGGTDLTLGAELRNPLSLGTAPVDLAFTAGVQGVLGDSNLFGAQVGLTAGDTFTPGTFSVTPYLHPRLALVDHGGRDTDLDADILAEVGADFHFTSGVGLRLAIGLDDTGASWGLGLTWR